MAEPRRVRGVLEINTRKTITGRTLETTVKAERALTEEDELSDAAKEDNKSDTKFGMNTSAEQGWMSAKSVAYIIDTSGRHSHLDRSTSPSPPPRLPPTHLST